MASTMGKYTSVLEELDEYIPRDFFSDLQRALGPLVKLENGAVRLSHKLAKDVILLKALKHPQFDGSPSIVGHLEIARFRLEYLLTEKVKEWVLHRASNGQRYLFPDRTMALLDYAVSYWSTHYGHVAPPFDSLSEYVLKILKDKSRMEILSRLLWEFGNPVTRRNFSLLRPLHVAVELGLSGIVSIISSSSSGYRVDHDDFALALELACQQGNVAMSSQLLDTGVIDSSGILKAIVVPCTRGIDPIVETLVRKLKQNETQDLQWAQLPARYSLPQRALSCCTDISRGWSPGRRILGRQHTSLTRDC